MQAIERANSPVSARDVRGFFERCVYHAVVPAFFVAAVGPVLKYMPHEYASWHVCKICLMHMPHGTYGCFHPHIL